MPRVTHVKSARKDNPVCNKGESYYWWKFRYGSKRYSLTYPKQSQLTQSAYLGAVYDLIDQAQDPAIELGDSDSLDSYCSDIRDEIENIQSECQESLDNMPEQLQYAPTGELLQERIDACETAMSDLDYIEAPDQWQEVIDAREEHDDWEWDEPDLKDFDSEEEYDEAVDAWNESEPDVEDFEDFDAGDIVETIEGMLV